MARSMGLDVGTKTIGVAISDELEITGQALTTVRRSNLRADLRALCDLIAAHEVSRVVIGLPLNMSGSEGPRAAESRHLGRALQETSGLAVEYWDERLSTVAAERALLEANVSRQRRKEVVDSVAAAIILQGWLDAHRAPSEEGGGPE